MSESDRPEYDEQDQAEVFDEDNYSLDGDGDPSADMKTLEELPDVLDVTRALGDSDVDDVHVAEDADEIEDEELDGLELEYDEDGEDDRLADDVEDEPDDNELLDEEDLDEADGVDEQEDDEAELEYVEDVDETRSNAGRAAQHMESRGELSEADLEELGYRDEGGQR
ncbi:MAG TPA: hypothetical protein VNA30_03340 [Mycobacteriales bacterium]|nr:hypothetical protein [Mycobacteriales bacterium]